MMAGRTVHAPVALRDYVATLIQRQVPGGGLLLGTSPAICTSHMPRVLAYIPTPPEEEGEGVPTLPQPSWVEAHAGQVQRMLPGGISVVGFFFVSKLEKAKVFSEMLMYLHGVAEELSLALLDDTPTRWYAYHTSLNSSEAHCRSLSSESADLAVETMKFEECADGFATFHLLHYLNLDITAGLAVSQADRERELLEYCATVISEEALLQVEGKSTTVFAPVAGEDSTAAAFALKRESKNLKKKSSQQKKKKGNDSSCEPTEVPEYGLTLYCPPRPLQTSRGSSTPSLLLSGNVSVLCTIDISSSVHSLLLSLREDLFRGLRARIEAMMEESLDASGAVQHVLQRGGTLPVPRRVLIRREGLLYSDWQFPGETEVDVRRRCLELLGDDGNTKEGLLCQETFPLPEKKPADGHVASRSISTQISIVKRDEGSDDNNGGHEIHSTARVAPTPSSQLNLYLILTALVVALLALVYAAV